MSKCKSPHTMHMSQILYTNVKYLCMNLVINDEKFLPK